MNKEEFLEFLKDKEIVENLTLHIRENIVKVDAATLELIEYHLQEESKSSVARLNRQENNHLAIYPILYPDLKWPDSED